MTNGSKEMSRHVEVVLKALDILDCFQTKPVLTLKEIMEITQLTRSRAMRLTGTLEFRGYLIYEAETRNFFPGSRVYTLGKVFETHNTLVALARPILRDLVAKTSEFASLYVIEGTDLVALAREKGIHEISYSASEGQRMELHAGAAGKTLLAYGPQEGRDSVLSSEKLKKLTSNTITNKTLLSKDLELIRLRGYAISEGERAADVWSVAAPVFDHRGVICCAIGVTGPRYRIPEQLQADFIEIVVRKAAEFSRLLGNKKSQAEKEAIS